MGSGGVITYAVGQTGTLYDTGSSANLATITVSAPTFVTTDANGNEPQFGYFANFTVTVKDIAPSSTQADIAPSDGDFYVQATDGQKYGVGDQEGVQSGYSILAAATDELGTNGSGGPVDLLPGQSTTGEIVIDVPSQHGELVYASGPINGAWKF